MLKVKHERDCDCVVAGFRWYKEAAEGRSVRCCWDSTTTQGALQHVGVCASFTQGEAARAGRVSRALSRECARRASVEELGRSE